MLATEVPSERGLSQKASYQRVIITTYVFLTLLALVTILESRPDTTATIRTDTERSITAADLHFLDRRTTDKLLGAVCNVPPVNRLEGFLGFRTITPDGDDLDLDINSTIPFDLYSIMDEDFYIPEDPISFSPEEGEGYRIEIPQNTGFYWHERDSDDEPQGISRGVAWVRKVKPDVPPSARMMGAEGYVEILLLIDERGRHSGYSVHKEDTIYTYPECALRCTLEDGSVAVLEFYVEETNNDLMYVTIKEEPTGYRFAEYVHMVLSENVFSPAIKNGKPMASFVRLGFYFGDYGQCLKADLRQSVLY